MNMPRLSEVFVICEAPAGSGLRRKANAMAMVDDPYRVSNHGEHYMAEDGEYCVFSAPLHPPPPTGKGATPADRGAWAQGKEASNIGHMNYRVHYVSSGGKFEEVGHFGNRQAAIDGMLQHHDRVAGGVQKVAR